MDYNPQQIDKKWQRFWAENETYKAENNSSKPKYYVLDMFPYPSGAGLHVGHPLGYIASDIFARYKRHKGFNVLHPMGYDSFGLPAEQYAIQTGQHPAITTEKNIARYREQLDKIGFSFDWSREVRTSDPKYYRWTQWIFKQLFNSWYNNDTDKAEDIDTLIAKFEANGTSGVNAPCTEELRFRADEWINFSEREQSDVLLNYRLAYRSESVVNWCPALGTVLANDEVKDGVSERGGHPVVQKSMMQWSMRITAYSQRLLEGLDVIDWSESLKESQRNWIGRSEGATVDFRIRNSEFGIEVFTTRPDTIFGATYMTLAPEHELVDQITTDEYREAVNAYKAQAAKRSERDRMADTKTITGQFTGAYAINPFTEQPIPIWIGDYVLAGYGTGAVMAVPAHDSRDYAFAKHFDLPIVEVVSGGNIEEESYDAKEGTLINSGLLNGLDVQDAIPRIIAEIEKRGLGKGKVNYRLRDAIFGRQRYWGEPIPVYYENEIPKLLPDDQLPLVLPEVDKYLPTEDGEPPLARATNWNPSPPTPQRGDLSVGNTPPLGEPEGAVFETTTMPGWAGSSWYFLRYMDPHNEDAFVSKEAEQYWQNIDLYVGGSEHATGHLLYARFWYKFLADRGWVSTQEPFKKLVNQGMIQGMSAFVYRVKGDNKFVSYNLRNDYETASLHADVSLLNGDELDIEAFKKWRPEFKDAEFILEDDKYICGREVEKMSKSKYNVVNPDDIVEKYGADVLRMYEMFLGPIEQSKPWNTQGLSGVSNFLRKFWRLFYTNDALSVSDEAANEKELKALHTCIKKVNEDIEAFSFNTSVSAFMICVNELTELKCNKRQILEPLTVLLSPFAPHIAEELWAALGHAPSVTIAPYPVHEAKYLVESTKDYPVSFNGKVRFNISLPADMGKEEIEKAALADERAAKHLEGKTVRKVIVVPGRIVNIVVG
jgi:leucyl-tRNA synthetase